MFIDPNDQIEIKIYYKRIGRHYEVHNEKDIEAMKEVEKSKYKLLLVKTRELPWGLYNELNEESVTKDNLGGRHWNYKLYKENKLRKIILSWDAKMADIKGNIIPVPLSSEQIAKLSPDIAEYILNAYDAIMFEEDEKEEKEEPKK